MSCPRLTVVLCGSLAAGCAVVPVPPLRHTAPPDTVLGLRADGETRASLREKLGAPDVLDVRGLSVWSWRQNLGHLVVVTAAPAASSCSMGANGGVAAWHLQGPRLEVLARYEGDRVVALETGIEGTGAPAAPLDTRASWTWNFDCSGSAEQVVGWAPALVCDEHDSAALDWEGRLWMRHGDGAPALVAAAEGPPGERGVLSLSPDGHALASFAHGRLSLHDRRTLRRIWTAPVAQASRILFSPDARWLAAGGERVRVIEAATGRVALSLDSGEPLAFSADGKRLLCLGGRELILHALDDGRITGKLVLPGDPAAMPEALRGSGWRLDAAFAGDDLLVAGASEATRWRVSEIEAAFASRGREVRYLGGADEPAAVDARLFPIFGVGEKGACDPPDCGPLVRIDSGRMARVERGAGDSLVVQLVPASGDVPPTSLRLESQSLPLLSVAFERGTVRVAAGTPEFVPVKRGATGEAFRYRAVCTAWTVPWL